MSDLRAVCLIPGVECLVHHDIGHWVSLFESRSEHTMTDLVLPAISMTGASYKSKYAPPVAGLADDKTLRHWVEAARNELGGVCNWALIDMQLAKLGQDMISLRDQWNQPFSDSCCIVNPQVQSILQSIFAEVRQLGVDGVVLDITDIFPNSTSGRYPARKTETSTRQPIQNTCFCKHCLKALERNGWTAGAENFTSIERNISRFVLLPTNKPDGGANPNTVEDLWLDTLDGEKLVEFANFRGFIEINSAEERERAITDAVAFIRYLTARSKVTAQAIKMLRAVAIQENLRTAVVLGSALFDQSQSVNLSTLLKLSCADEYWTESFEPEHLSVGATDSDEAAPILLRLMAVRGTYYINTVFEYLDVISRLRTFNDDEPVNRRFVETADSLDRRDQLDTGQCAQISLFAGLKGFVGVPFKTDDLRDLVKRMAATGSMAEPVKNELLARLGTSKLTMGAAETDSQIGSVWG